MTFDLVAITLIVGVGTWALRVLPTKLDLSAGKPDGPLSRFLAATGPAAIAALFVAAIMPELAPDLAVLAPIALGATATAAMFALRPDIALATFAGAIVYGGAFALIGG